MILSQLPLRLSTQSICPLVRLSSYNLWESLFMPRRTFLNNANHFRPCYIHLGENGTNLVKGAEKSTFFARTNFPEKKSHNFTVEVDKLTKKCLCVLMHFDEWKKIFESYFQQIKESHSKLRIQLTPRLQTWMQPLDRLSWKHRKRRCYPNETPKNNTDPSNENIWICCTKDHKLPCF